MVTSRLRTELAERGVSICTPPPRSDGETVASSARRAPWQLARDLFDEMPLMVEMQPIEPRDGARSFAATRVHTPLHTDSQSHRGAPPDAIVMCCARPAADDRGKPLVADAWAFASDLERSAPALFEQLVTVPRRIPFVFGDVWGPTLGLRGASLAFTHSPMPPRPDDPVGHALLPHLRALVAEELTVRAGDVLVIDNRRMLHGRTAFAASPAAYERSFVRLLVWLRAPLGVNRALAARAHLAATSIDAALDETAAPPWLRARLGRAPDAGRPDDATARRLSIVLEMLRGAPPGMLAARESIPEPELYRWRDAVMTVGADALSGLPSAVDADAALVASVAALKFRGSSR